MKNVKADLSIVVVSYNTLEMTRECLSSIFDQSANKQKIEVIVIDNASSDGSVEMIERLFKQVKLIKNRQNLGFAAANNLGFNFASADYVLLLNSDTVVLGDVLEQSVKYLQSNPEVGAMGCRILNTDKSMQASCSGYPTLWRLLAMTIGLDRLFCQFDQYRLRCWQRDSERDVEVISGCYLLVRREIINKVGYLDENFFFFGEETDWCLRMRMAGWKLRFAPVGEIIHHGGGSVKKLNFKRDVMLTDATIRLHRKNGGIYHARVAFLILCLFNISRALFWSIASLINPRARLRASHFWNVVASTSTTWPKS